jgi:hypothetical protein
MQLLGSSLAGNLPDKNWQELARRPGNKITRRAGGYQMPGWKPKPSKWTGRLFSPAFCLPEIIDDDVQVGR